MSRGPLLLDNAYVLTLDEDDTRGALDIVVVDGLIDTIRPAGTLAAAIPAADRIDCRNRILMPGLVNAHLHPEMHVLKGMVESLGLHDWARVPAFERALELLGSDEMRWAQRAAIRACLADCVLGGTTCVATYGVTVGADELSVETLESFGLRGHVTVRDTSFAPLPAAEGRPATTMSPPRMYRLHAEEALTAEELDAAALAHGRGERLVMHAAETALRIGLMERRFGGSTIDVLDRWGLLSSRMLLSHAVHVSESERTLLARRNTPVVASPTAEMKLSDGIAPIEEYVRLGMTVALGTDGAVCNNGHDMFLECRQLALLQKLHSGAGAMPAERVLRIATAGGARALGEEGRYGVLTPGASADLILVDASNPRMQPLMTAPGAGNVAASLVFAATGQDVTDAMVAGQWLVRDRRLLVADAHALWRDLARAADEIHRRIAVE